MNKGELFQRINAARSRLDAAIAQIPDAHMGDIAVYGLWTMKDFLAHVASWERYVIDIHEALTAGREPRHHFDTTPVDALNEETLQRSQTQTLEAVREEYITTHGDLLRLVEEAPAESLFSADYWPYTNGSTFERWLAVSTYEHYDEHLPDVIGFLQTLQS